MRVQSNITRILFKHVEFNWFKRRILHGLNSAIRLGVCKMGRLNQAYEEKNYIA